MRWFYFVALLTASLTILPPRAFSEEPADAPQDAAAEWIKAKAWPGLVSRAPKSVNPRGYTPLSTRPVPVAERLDHPAFQTWLDQLATRDSFDNEFPGFQVSQLPTKLPDLGVPFGLSMVSNRVTDQDIVNLSHLENLKWLDLSATRISEVGLRSLSKLERLETLILKPRLISQEEQLRSLLIGES